MRLFVSDFEALEKDASEQDGVLDWTLCNKDILRPFRFDCGHQDLLIEPNRNLHKALAEPGIAHIYEEFPGEHSWNYWVTHIRGTLLFFNQV